MLVLSFANQFNQNMIKLNYYMYLLLYLSLPSHQFERNKVMQYHKYITCICLIILKLILFLQFEEKESHTLLQEHTEYFCAEGLMRYSVIFYCYKCVQFFICKLDLSNCFSFRRQHGRVVSTSDLQCCSLGFVESCSGQATNWICSWLLRVEILSHACKLPTGCLLPFGVFSPVMLYVDYLFPILFIFFYDFVQNISPFLTGSSFPPNSL